MRKEKTASKILSVLILSLMIGSMFGGLNVVQAASSFSISDLVEVQNTLDKGLKVRNLPAGSEVKGTKFDGARGVIIDGPQSAPLSGVTYTWWRIQWKDDGLIGWSAEGYPGGVYYLKKVVPEPPTAMSPGSNSEPGTVIDTLTPTLQWVASFGADYYALAISKYPYGSGNIVYNPQQLYGTSNPVPSGILEYGTKYRWNMQAHSSAGWSAVSNTLYFQTQTIQTPTVETRAATDVTDTAATLNAMITSDGGASIDERRFDWGKTSSCSDGWTRDVTVSGNSFSYRLTGLQPSTTYYFRAWAHNTAGWSYGGVLSFTTKSQPVPQYTINFYTSPSNVGSITFSGTTYTNGQSGSYTSGSYPISANVPSGYTFSSWSVTGGISVGNPTIPSTTSSVSGSGSITANFIQSIKPTLSVQVTANPSSITTTQSSTIKATVTSGGSPVSGASVSLSSDGGSLSPTSGTTDSNGLFTSLFSSGNPGTFTITASASKSGFNSGSGQTQVVVSPQSLPTITFYTNPSTVGSITFSGTTYTNGQFGSYASGTYSVTANVPSGYTFSSWSCSGGVSVASSTSATTTAIVSSSGSLTANFNTQFDFRLSVSPSSRTIKPGESTTYDVTVSLVSGSPLTSVSLSLSGQHNTMSSKFDPSSGFPTFTSKLTVSTDSSTPANTYTLTVTASVWYLGLTKTQQVSLIVGEKSLPLKAAELAIEVIGAKYAWGAKGWDIDLKTFLNPIDIKTKSYRYSYVDSQTRRTMIGYGPGLDCSGLIFWTYNKAYGATKYQSRTNPIYYEGADNQYRYDFTKKINEADLKPGDVLFFDFVSNRDYTTPKKDGKMDHVAMYVGPFYYPGGTIEGVYYTAGTYDCVHASAGKGAVVPDTKENLKNLKINGVLGFKEFRRWKGQSQ